MKKIIVTIAAVATAMTVLTGCQTKPVKETTGATTEAVTQETTEAATQETTKETVAEKLVSLEDLYTAVKETYGDKYIPSMPYDEQAMKELFGIPADLYDSYIAEGPMISVHVDNFVAIEAKEGKGEQIEKILDQYRETLLTESLQYPVNLPKIEASQVVRHGDYVFFVMLGEVAEGAEDEAAALEAAKESNQIGIDVIDGFFVK